ncbi:MAG: hypothetical protein JSS63_05100 [Bacteroidetes bacterium]|nr:hypothetical protein [Bacteroidota bacterium]
MSNESTPPFKEVYALIWKANEPDGVFNPQEFQDRIPRLMEWLKSIYKKGKLVACGGGGFENHSGGLTLISADSIEDAVEISNGSPMNEIGKTEIMIWDVFYGELNETKQVQKLES